MVSGMNKPTMAAFRRVLNAQDKLAQERGHAKHREGPYRQLKRLYGDYLYFQDRERFDVEYREWLKEANP